MMTLDFSKPIRCLLNSDPASGRWVAHCLDFDLVTSGKTDEAAWTNIKAVVKLHIEHCFTHDNDGMFKHRVDQELIDSFDAGKGLTEVWSDKIRLNLVAPKKEADDKITFWIKGVELAQTSTIQAVH
jgi:predicted RNase H-like HicB family nuclease